MARAKVDQVDPLPHDGAECPHWAPRTNIGGLKKRFLPLRWQSVTGIGPVVGIGRENLYADECWAA